MLKSHTITSIGRVRSNLEPLNRNIYRITSNIRDLSISSRPYVDEVKSRRSRTVDAFQEFISTGSKSTIDVPSHPISDSLSLNLGNIQVEKSPNGPRRISRNLENVQRNTNRENNYASTPWSSGKTHPARKIAANWSNRLRRDRAAGGGNGRQPRRARIRGAPRKPRKKPWEEEAEPPYSDEEIEYLDARDGGFTMPYNPDTGLHNLSRHRPSVIVNETGMLDSIRYRLAVTTDNVSPQYRISSQHLMRIERGNGTIFEDQDQRAIIQEWKDKLDYERATANNIPHVREELSTLPKKTREKIMKQWAAGNYESPGNPSAKNPFTYVRNYANRNETWLGEDTKKFEAVLASLLPPDIYQR